ncbi:TetR/AcrR family transcriptional regulator [Paenibacillus xylanivorans]|uniref:TetR family transcriptional regulator n=1 Tax=Paenibacillus xylanivorans TaxID=1705561 RepID=A0A0N0C3Y8_9BACL|nr:TetR/AcrR family transcriptional regulator [Paenibacillus xylanivorans]KOY15031.1 TetR family transcriptional regulator [Paenibacillus xylanivorans]
MGKDKVDLRVFKTKKSIKSAFITLVPKKGYQRITVQDIADEAMINRNTFYLHYEDKHDLMDKLCRDSMENLNVCLSLNTLDIYTINKEMLTSILDNIFQNIESDLDFFKVMLDLNSQPIYLTEVLKNYILNAFGDQYQEKDMKVGLEYIVSGLVGIICLWIRESNNLKHKTIVEQLSNIHFSNIQEVFFKGRIVKPSATVPL